MTASTERAPIAPAAKEVGAAFVRRAVEMADQMALRMALLQLTGDEAFEVPHAQEEMSEAQRKAWLVDRATEWLLENAGPRELPEPPEAKLRQMMDMASGAPKMGDMEFNCRRDLTSFKQFPYMVHWTDKKPKLPEGFKVAVIGSGMAGVIAGVQLDLLDLPYTIYERRSEPGGVWSTNRYPDVRVDTISITYEMLFEKDHIWSEHFARGPEVRKYVLDVAKKNGVYQKTCFGHDVQKAVYDETRDVWKLTIKTPDGELQTEANAIISCAGLFATPLVVNFPGRDSFKGQIIHTTAYPDDQSLKGKRVAVIGNGSTGVQLLSAVAAEADHVTVFQRTPQWISPRDKYGQAMEPEAKWLLKNLPGYRNWWRFTATAPLFETHALLTVDPEWQAKGGKINKHSDAMRDFLTDYIKRETGGRQDLIDKVLPDYAPLSRRPVVDNGWYRALTRDNVELLTTGIKTFTPEGIQTEDGKNHPFDVIITATGFEVAKFLAPAQYIGKGGADLHARWEAKDGARAYLGMMNPDFPNLWTLYGPNSQPVSGGPAQPVWFSIWMGFAAHCLVKMLESGKTEVDVTQEAFDRYNAALDKEAGKLVQMTKEGGFERNYYVNQKHNRLQVNAPWYSPYYHQLCSEISWGDLKIS
jgi:4-hydroxyacetophenone monooxygenase